MAFIWQNPEWPSYSYDKEEVDRAYSVFLEEKKKTDAVFSILDEKTRQQIHVKSIADEIVASQGIEGENISYESVFSSVSKRLDATVSEKGKTDAYADSVSSVAVDAIENRAPLTKDRIDGWNKSLFENYTGRKPKTIGDYRKGPEYILKWSGKGPEVVYTAVPFERVREEMDKFLCFVRSENETNAVIKSAIAALWFVIIHPYEDGNGRISRAIADYLLSDNSGSALRTYSISSFILANRKDYYTKINEISAQNESLDITSWILWNLEIMVKAQIDAVETLRKMMRLTSFMRSLDPSLFNSRELSMLYKLADGSFFGKLSTEKWAKMTKCSPAAAQRDIHHLVMIGYLVPDGDKGPKTGYFLNPQIMPAV